MHGYFKIAGNIVECEVTLNIINVTCAINYENFICSYIAKNYFYLLEMR